MTSRQSTFSNNQAPQRYGGAILGNGDIRIETSTFSDNSAGFSGGAINLYSDAVVTHSTFTGNTAHIEGGVFVSGLGVVTINGSSFSQFLAMVGAGIATPSTIEQAGTLVVDHNAFSGNRASFGGGMFVRPTYSVSLTHSTLSSNTALTQGGGIYTAGALPVFDHTTITDNIAVNGPYGTGGGIFVCEEGQVLQLGPQQIIPCHGTETVSYLTHSTVSGNSPDNIRPDCEPRP